MNVPHLILKQPRGIAFLDTYAFLGTSVLNVETPTTALVDSLVRQRLEAELKSAFRFRLPEVASVKGT